jgi:hypothetical protein
MALTFSLAGALRLKLVADRQAPYAFLIVWLQAPSARGLKSIRPKAKEQPSCRLALSLSPIGRRLMPFLLQWGSFECYNNLYVKDSGVGNHEQKGLL